MAGGGLEGGGPAGGEQAPLQGINHMRDCFGEDTRGSEKPDNGRDFFLRERAYFSPYTTTWLENVAR